MVDRIGQQLGNYRLIKLLGEGGFSEVYLGEHIHLGTEAAIKILRAQLASSDIEQFRKEARTIARLEHPHIVRVLDFGVEDSTPFLVMSYAPNGTLRKRHPKKERLSLSVVLPYVLDIADALYYTHTQKLIHRDVKPENLLIGRNNEILLGDFGIALIAQSTHMNTNYDMAGTVTYMAPEQLQSHPRPASDQYSLGVVVYEWLTGERPFSGSFVELVAKHSFVSPPPMRERVSGIPPAVEHVVMTALAKDPQQRFATVKAFATALAQASGLPEFATTFQSTSGSLSGGYSAPLFPVPQGPVSNPSTPLPLVAPQAPLLTPVVLPTPSQIRMPVVSPNPLEAVDTPALQPSSLDTTVNSTGPTSNSTQHSPPLMTPVFSHTDMPEPLRSTLSRRSLLVGIAGGVVGAGAVGGLAWFLAAHNRSGSNNPAATSTEAVVLSSYSSQGTMFGYDLGRTHYNPQENILSPANVAHLAPVAGWNINVFGGIISSPVVFQGMVYVGSWDQHVYAFDALSGKQKWTVSTGSSIDSSPAIANNTLYIASQDAMVYAFNASTGAAAWRAPFKTGGTIDFSSPTVAGGILYIGSHDHRLYALNAQDGTQLWSAKTNDEIWSSPTVVDGIVYVSSRDNYLYALNARDGKRVWKSTLHYGSDSSPAVANGIVYVGSYDSKVYAFEAKTGKPAWPEPFETGNNVNASPAVADGKVFIGSADHKLYALDAVSGKPVWAAPAQTDEGIESSAMVANGVVYIGSDDSTIYAFAASNGQKLWSYKTGGAVFSSPAVTNGVLYIASEDKKLYAFKVPSA